VIWGSREGCRKLPKTGAKLPQNCGGWDEGELQWCLLHSDLANHASACNKAKGKFTLTTIITHDLQGELVCSTAVAHKYPKNWGKSKINEKYSLSLLPLSLSLSQDLYSASN
jgi:hypothetical protein